MSHSLTKQERRCLGDHYAACNRGLVTGSVVVGTQRANVQRRMSLRFAISVLGSVGCARSAVDAEHRPRVAHAAPEAHHPHWAYDGTEGPAAWGTLASEYRQCATGHRQSPIALALDASELSSLPPLAFHYGPTEVDEVNTGHTIQEQTLVRESVELSGRSYRLEQFHFHHPSEHTLDGVHYPLEIHFVHRSAAGALLVVGVLVGEGAEHAALGVLFDKLPHDHESIRLSIDTATLLPDDHHYVTYAGSLTTPPCTEGVTWDVLRTPITASAEQLQRFATLFPHNNRPVMPLDGRRVRVQL